MCIRDRSTWVQAGGTLLVAEDDKFCQDMLSKMLDTLKVKYIMTKNGDEAVKTYQAKSGEIKLILLDLHMPVKDGFQAALEIRAHQKKIGAKSKIYGLSGDDDEDTFEKALDCGMDSIIKKPIQKASLEQIFK
eukprot:TRINITY_DN1491_c0_g1_i1.p4 TRINITY_DN1491_c0_g1~~TRINITY_DN1491_c0_g1_i1.p4  ORF type:complete len:133 (+),score=37.51 TRINITY_DN1491_c0_g1_i1:158-556(+)